MTKLSRTAWLATGAIGVASITAAGVGIATAATHSKVIHGCVSKSDGVLRVIHAGHHCRADESQLSFNAKGPRGLPGVSAKPATYQMFANVDAEGDLGSNYGVSSDTRSSTGDYIVTFKHSILHCALEATPGGVGGPDQGGDFIAVAQYFAIADPTHKVRVTFTDPTSDDQPNNTPFMITATCLT
jgi:hypothetical protein